jgi:hypothetical protein
MNTLIMAHTGPSGVLITVIFSFINNLPIRSISGKIPTNHTQPVYSVKSCLGFGRVCLGRSNAEKKTGL